MDEAQRRILIIRLSAIGDVVHGLPVLRALRDAMPRAFVAWVIEESAAGLLRGDPALDELIVLKRRWYRSLAEMRQVRRRVRAYRFDTTIDLQGLTKSAGIARATCAALRIGFAGRDGRELSQWLNNRCVLPRATHIVDRNLELLAPLGIEHPGVRFDLRIAEADEHSAAAMLRSLDLPGRFALVNPGAGWPSKLWPIDRYAAVARHLGARRALPSLVVWAKGEERAWADQIVAASAGFARLAPATTLGELAAIARRATLFIGSDTGPLHIAAAVGASCVGLFGPVPAERNGPYGPRHAAVQKMRLAGSSRYRRGAGPESMLAIQVEHVAAACDEILARNARARQSA
jgi:lipopolysaccharide heptosyltransferase I